MKTYESKTGYIKCISTGEIYEGFIIYLGCNDDPSNYCDGTKEEWDEQERKREEEMRRE